MTLLWKYTKHAENINKVDMQGSGGRSSTVPRYFDQRFQGVPCFAGGPNPKLSNFCSVANVKFAGDQCAAVGSFKKSLKSPNCWCVAQPSNQAQCPILCGRWPLECRVCRIQQRLRSSMETSAWGHFAGERVETPLKCASRTALRTIFRLRLPNFAYIKSQTFRPPQAPRCLNPDTNLRLSRQRSHCSCFTKRPLTSAWTE